MESVDLMERGIDEAACQSDPIGSEEIIAWVQREWPVAELVTLTRTEARERLGLTRCLPY